MIYYNTIILSAETIEALEKEMSHYQKFRPSSSLTKIENLFYITMTQECTL